MREYFTDTWVVIPLFNEQPVIASVVSDVLRVFPNVVCVDDGSADGSAAAASMAGAHVLRHPINLGQGAALQTGFDFVRDQTDARYLLTFDADGQHLVSDAAKMRRRAESDDLAVVLGSRFLGAPLECGFVKKLGLQAGAALTRWRGGLQLTDTHNGLRLLRRDAFEQIHLTQFRMAHASEIIHQIEATKLPYGEESVHIRYSDYSRAKGQSTLNSINIFTELLFK